MKYNFIVSRETDFDKSTYSFCVTSKSIDYKFKGKSVINTKELILNKNDLDSNYDYIYNKYKIYRRVLGNKLNQIHDLSLSPHFWNKAFNYFLFRLISALWIRYNKFKQYDSDSFNTRIISKVDFYYTNDTIDSFQSFLYDDLYQDQVFSIYLNIFYPNKIFKVGNYPKRDKINNCILKSSKKIDLTEKKFNKILITHTYINKLVLDNIPSDNITTFDIPRLETNHFKIEYDKRSLLLFNESIYEDEFDKFFYNSLKYLLPKSYLEGFKYLYDYYNAIDLSETKVILCENWVSDDKLSIFLATQKEKNISHYSLAHGYNFLYEKNWGPFLSCISDKYVSYGWEDKNIANLVKAGLWRLNPSSNATNEEKENQIVIFLSYANTYLYDTEISDIYMNNNASQKSYFIKTKKFFESLSKQTRQKITYKPYPVSHSNWYEYKSYQEVIKECKKFDHCVGGYGAVNIFKQSKLVIIGGLGSAFFESLLCKVPTIIFYDKEFIFLNKQYQKIFKELEYVGILHSCPKKMANFIEGVVDNPWIWWRSIEVRKVLEKFNNLTADSTLFNKFLYHLLKEV